MAAVDDALAKHFDPHDGPEPFFLTHLQGEGGELTRVTMEQRVGRPTWVCPRTMAKPSRQSQSL